MDRGHCLENRPTTAFILSLLGGLFMVLGTVVATAFMLDTTYYYTPAYYYPFLLTSAVCGFLVLIAAAFLFKMPGLHMAWGIVVLVLSVTGTVGVLTGYFAFFGAPGVVFGVIGGSMAIAWRPGAASPGAPVGFVRVCPGCGRYTPVAYAFCVSCGTPAPAVHPQAVGPATPPPSMPPRP